MPPRKRALPTFPVPAAEPPEPSADAIDAFVRGGAERPAERPAKRPGRARGDGTRAVVRRRSGAERRRTTVYFDADVWDALERARAVDPRELSVRVNELVRRALTPPRR